MADILNFKAKEKLGTFKPSKIRPFFEEMGGDFKGIQMDLRHAEEEWQGAPPMCHVVMYFKLDDTYLFDDLSSTETRLYSNLGCILKGFCLKVDEEKEEAKFLEAHFILEVVQKND